MNNDNTEKRDGPIAKMAGNSVAANLAMLVLIVGGLIMALQVKQEVFPEISEDAITVTVSYPGATPEDVETGIVMPVEEAIQGLDGVKEITSTAGESSGKVVAKVVEGEDVQTVFNDIKNEVDRITTFPDGAEEPRVFISAGGHARGVLSLILSGDAEYKLLRDKAEEIRDDLISDPGITAAELDEAPNHEVRVEVPQANLRRYSLTMDDIAKRVKRSSIDLPGGALETKDGDILVRVRERKDFAGEFARIPVIIGESGSEVELGDIANVRADFEDIDLYSSYNGQRAVRINVQRVGEETPGSVSSAVQEHVDRLRKSMPDGLQLNILNDRSKIFEQRMDLLLKNAYLGLGLVFILLALFLEARLAFWVALGIPISFLGSFLLLSGTDISINMISMFAFIVTLGIVVDDAIVTGENIYYYRQKGLGALQASIKGAKSIALPIVFSVLTNIVAYMPMLFVPGMMGKVFKQIPIIVSSVFIISLVESLFILPAHLAHQKQASAKSGPLAAMHALQQKFSRHFMSFVHNKYGPFLEVAVKNRLFTLSLALFVIMVCAGYVGSGRMGMTLFPSIESDFSYVQVDLPVGSPLSRTKSVTEDLVRAARDTASGIEDDNKLIQGVYSKVGGSAGTNRASLYVYLTDPDTRPISTSKFTAKWRENFQKGPEVDSIRFKSDMGGPGSGAGLSVQLSHSDIDKLREASSELAEDLRDFPVLSQINDGYTQGKRQFSFEITPEARSVGLRSSDVAGRIRDAYYGNEAIRQIRRGNEVKVMVGLPQKEKNSVSDLMGLILQTPQGGEIPLRDAVEVTKERGFTSINREQGKRVNTVTGQVTPESRANQVINTLTREDLPELQRRYAGLEYDFSGKQEEMRESMTALFNGLMLALLCIYALLAIPFKSYLQPLIIMVSIPFGLVGAVIGHLIMGYSMSIMSMFGIVALSGVVVNDSLVLISFANQGREQGLGPVQAVKEAGMQRFRPVLLTTLTTFFGLSPMIFETSLQARFLIPMALSLGFGILFATGIILVLVPCLYSLLEDFRDLTARS